MILEKGYLYHIYNQGNNQRKIFFKRDNYLFFLKKLNIHLKPYADILAWCLMPNHFHLMVFVREKEIKVTTHTVTSSHGVSKKRTINDSIGIMLRSYTRAINKQEKFTGKLFREKTKAECLNCPNGVTPNFFIENGGPSINIQNSEIQYPQVCFNYIHQNPVKANLVSIETDYEFSSARDYAGIRDGKLINKKVAFEYVNFN
jgi:putative transposase